MKKGKRTRRKLSEDGRKKDIPDRSLSNSGSRQTSSKLLYAFIVGAAFVVYLLCFFSQPSSLPLQDENGQTVDRLTELLILPTAAQGIFGAEGSSLVLVDRVPFLLGMFAWIAIAWWIGGVFTRTLQGHADRLVIVAIDVLVGLALLSTLTMVIGQVQGLTTRWPLAFAILVLVSFATWARRREANVEPGGGGSLFIYSQEIERQEISDTGSRWLLRWIQIGCCILVGFYLLSGVQPPWEFDVVEYHLQAAKEFYQDGGLYSPSYNVYLSMPLSVEMHALAPMTLLGADSSWWAGALVGKAVAATCSLVAALLLFGFVRQQCADWCAWCVASLLLASAGCIHVSAAGLVDMVVGAYTLATVITLIYFWPKIVGGTVSISSLVLIAMLAGGACACKYPAIPCLLIPIVVLLGIGTFQSESRDWLTLAAGLLAGLSLTIFPWICRNLIETANPFYPLASQLFPTPGLDADQIARWNAAHSPQEVGGSGPYSLAAVWDSFLQLTIRSPMLNPSVWFLAALGATMSVWSAIKNRQRLNTGISICILLVAASLSIWWLATHRIDRFWLPVWPIVVLLSTFGIVWMRKHVANSLALVMVAFGVCYGMLQAFSGAAMNDNRIFQGIESLRSEAGFDSRIAWINENLPGDANVLAIGEAKAFYFQMPVQYATCFNTGLGEELLSAGDETTVRRGLEGFGATHVYVNWAEIRRYRSPGNYGFSEWPQRWHFNELQERGILKELETPFSSEDAQVFEVVVAKNT
ncbi:MAG: hypothetical protein ACE361_24450 [Aureliella sp.]